MYLMFSSVDHVIIVVAVVVVVVILILVLDLLSTSYVMQLQMISI